MKKLSKILYIVFTGICLVMIDIMTIWVLPVQGHHISTNGYILIGFLNLLGLWVIWLVGYGIYLDKKIREEQWLKHIRN